MRSILLLAIILTFGCGGAASTESTTGPSAVEAGDLQRVVLHRPHRVGDTFVVTYRGESRTREVVKLNDQVGQDEQTHLTIELIASVVIQSVNSQGKPTSSELTVRSCTTGGNAPEELLPAGSVLLVTAVEGEGDGTIALQGGELTEDQRARLDVILSTSISARGDDDVFGTVEPQSVGASWPVHSNVVAEDLSADGNLELRPEQVTGSTTLVGLEEVDGVPCQRVEANMMAAGFALTRLAEGSVMQDSSMQMRSAGAFPTDTSRQRLRSQQEMIMRIVVQLPAPEGSVVLMTVTNMRATTTRIHP